MNPGGDGRGTASGLRSALPGRRVDRDADRYARDDDARAHAATSDSDGASEDSEDGSLSPEDAELLAKLEAEAVADRDADKEALAAFAKVERARRRGPMNAVRRIFAAPARILTEVYASPDSLMTFSRSSKLRRACESLRNNPNFEIFIFVCVLVNGVLIALIKPEAQMDAGARAIVPAATGTALQATFVVIFTLEAAVKIIAMGFLIGPDCYLRHYWNVLDFVVVVAGLIDFISSSVGAALTPLRLIRALQPLRALNKFRSGRLVLVTLGASLPLLIDVVLFMMWFVVAMTVMGVMFFGGTMTDRAFFPRSASEAALVNDVVFAEGGASRTEGEFDLARAGFFPRACGLLREAWVANGTDGAARAVEETEPIAGYTVPGDEELCPWDKRDRVLSSAANVSSTASPFYAGFDQPRLCCDSDLAPFNDYVRFDNFAQGVFVVLQIMTIDGWNEVTWPMCDSNGFAKPFAFAAATVVIGGFVIIQLFTSVICATLGDVNQDDDRVAVETNDVDALAAATIVARRDAVTNSETAAAMSKMDAKYREIELATAFRALVHSTSFENFIMACIVLNSLMMITSHHDPAKWYIDVTGHAERAFTVAFIAEFTLKHLALGFGGYWGDSWNRLDGLIVVSSVIELIMLEAFEGGSGVNLSFLRVFRVFRVMRTLRVMRENKEFVRILESAVNGLQAMWVFLVVWALLLMIFAILGVQLFGGQGDLDDERLGFRDIGSALLTLFVVSTGENTFEVAYATIVATDEWSGLYMIAWLVISTAVLSLILGILIDSITAEGDEQQAALEEAEGQKKRESAFAAVDARVALDEDEDDAIDHEALGGGRSAKGKQARRVVDPVVEKARKDAEKVVARKREQKKQRHSRADVAVVRRWLVSIGEASHTRESLVAERALTPGQKLAARKRMDAFDSRSRRRIGGAVAGIGSVRKLNARTLDELEEDAKGTRESEDEKKLAVMKRELADRMERRRRERCEKETVLDASEVTTDAVTWARVRPPRWQRDELDIDYEDEDGQPKSEVRLRREEEEFHREQRTHRANLRVILGVLGIPNPKEAFSGGDDDAKTFASLTAYPRGGLHSEASRKVLALKHVTTASRGWGGGRGFLGLEGGSGRLLALRVVTHPFFELFILLSIGVSSGLLAAETHAFPRSGTRTAVAFVIADATFTALFGSEMLAKMYAFQVYSNPASYLRSSFNVLDLVVVAASLLTLVFESVGALRSLRLLRALRPLRSVHKLPSLKVVINAMIASVPAISHVCLLGLGLGTVLSITGMELFQGKMWYCAALPSRDAYVAAASDASVAASTAAGGGLDRAACLAAGGTWRNNKFNFDNFADAMVSVFVISTGDNWQDIMYVAMDGVGDGEAPSRDHSGWAAAYFVLVVLVAMLFWANLFVSALVDNFNRMAANGGPVLVSDEQRRWQQAMQLATISHLERWRLAPPKNMSKFRRTIHRYCKQPAFDTVVTFVVFLNLLAMVAYRHDASTAETTAQEVFDYFFTFFYIAEASLLIAAMGWKMYWSNFMYKVDFVVALVGFVDFAVPSLREAGLGDAFRAARFLRMVKLIKISRGLRTLSLTFVQSLPAVVNISLLSALVIFIYACLGVSLYGADDGPFGAPASNLALSEYGNFTDFPRAFVVLFVSYTGNWMSYFSDMFRDQRCDALVIPESALDEATGLSTLSCSRDAGAVFYAFSFVVIAIFLLANLFVAVILEQFSACADKEGVFGGSGIVDLVITTVQLRKIAKLVKGRVMRHRHASDAARAYTSVASRGSPDLRRIRERSMRGTGFGDAVSRRDAADAAGAAVRGGGEATEDGAGAPGASRFGARDAAAIRGAPPATPATPAPAGSGGYASDGSDAGRSAFSAAPSRRGDGDSDEDEEGARVMGNDERAGRRARRRGNRAAASLTTAPDVDIDLDDVL